MPGVGVVGLDVTVVERGRSVPVAGCEQARWREGGLRGSFDHRKYHHT
jgi:hypothetical protein